MGNIETNPYIRRDANSGAIINTDERTLSAYKKRKAHMREFKQLQEDMKQAQETIKRLEIEIASLKQKGME